MKNSELNGYEQTMKRALRAAGAILRKGFARHGKVSFKDTISPVTKVDVAAEKAIIKTIRSRYPDHHFLGEESTYLKNKPAEGPVHRWIIDPLDGTVNFIHGIPHSSVSIGLEFGGKLLVGGVYDPFRDELFSAVRGRGAKLNGRKIQVAKETRLIRSLMITGFPYDSVKNAANYTKLIAPVLKRTMGVRRFGSAAIDLAWIAAGRSTGYWEYTLSPWDVAGGVLIVQEAGGKVTDFDGKPFDVYHPKQILATNGRIHSAVLSIFRKHRA